MNPVPSVRVLLFSLTLALAGLAADLAPVRAAEARMAVDPALAAAGAPLPVTGANPRRWDRPIAFGPYRTSAVRDGGTLGWSVELLNLGAAGSKRPYAFTLETPGGPVDAECHQKGLEGWHQPSGVTVDLRAAMGKPALVCAFRPATGGAAGADGGAAGGGAWVLELAAARKLTGGFVGVLRPADETAGGSLTIRSVHALEKSPIPLGSPAGYALERDGRAVAAVEVINAGRVWLSGSSAPAPAALPAALAALLLFQPPE
ncbi:MAG: hypothetical protein MUF27_17090 [Acidobacteria bacterium]|nr:hypothetical protein [Acidobacteriota bacterium]